MKLRLSGHRNRALTMYEVLVVIIVALLLALLLLPRLTNSHNGDIYCTMNLKRVGVAFLEWSVSHDGFPTEVSVAHGGAMESVATGNLAACFCVLSNVLGSPEVLICPNDRYHTAATNFETGFNNLRISYFINMDANDAHPRQILCGDANLAIDGVPVKSGVLELSTNAPIGWTKARHPYGGNVAFADGSVTELSADGLQSALDLSTNGTPGITNRLAIP